MLGGFLGGYYNVVSYSIFWQVFRWRGGGGGLEGQKKVQEVGWHNGPKAG